VPLLGLAVLEVQVRGGLLPLTMPLLSAILLQAPRLWMAVAPRRCNVTTAVLHLSQRRPQAAATAALEEVSPRPCQNGQTDIFRLGSRQVVATGALEGVGKVAVAHTGAQTHFRSRFSLGAQQGRRGTLV
jgi:hypothetical protein